MQNVTVSDVIHHTRWFQIAANTCQLIMTQARPRLNSLALSAGLKSSAQSLAAFWPAPWNLMCETRYVSPRHAPRADITGQSANQGTFENTLTALGLLA